MSMNFDEINMIYDHMEEKIYPHLKSPWNNVSTEEIIVNKYLGIIDSNPTYQLLAVPYLLHPEKFLTRFHKQCIIFYNTPDPSDGLMLVLHQINPKLHVHSRYFSWVENDTVHDYLACVLLHKNGEESVKFIQQNKDIRKTGDSADRKNSGFKI